MINGVFMSKIRFEFDQERTIESIIYLAKYISHPTKLVICKLLYFADLKSLDKYGRFITGDKYVAMQHGPVPSNALDLINATADGANYGFKLDGRIIEPLRDFDPDEFSESDIEILQQTVAGYGNYHVSHLVDLSHDNAYHSARNRSPHSNNPNMLLEDMVDKFDYPEDIMDFLKRHSEG